HMFGTTDKNYCREFIEKYASFVIVDPQPNTRGKFIAKVREKLWNNEQWATNPAGFLQINKDNMATSCENVKTIIAEQKVPYSRRDKKQPAGRGRAPAEIVEARPDAKALGMLVRLDIENRSLDEFANYMEMLSDRNKHVAWNHCLEANPGHKGPASQYTPPPILKVNVNELIKKQKHSLDVAARARDDDSKPAAVASKKHSGDKAHATRSASAPTVAAKEVTGKVPRKRKNKEAPSVSASASGPSQKQKRTRGSKTATKKK
ncbi:MAG: hypothetical protein SGARI_006717, partial [Bacillariaceae sp.]